MPLDNIPLGSSVYNIELRPGRGGALVRSAGTTARAARRLTAAGSSRRSLGSGRAGRIRAFALKSAVFIVEVVDVERIGWSGSGRGRHGKLCWSEHY